MNNKVLAMIVMNLLSNVALGMDAIAHHIISKHKQRRQLQDELRDAIRRGNTDDMKACKDKGAALQGDEGDFPLREAMSTCNADIVKLLLEWGVEPNAADLHYAAVTGTDDILNLVATGERKPDMRALIEVIRQNNIKRAERLLDMGLPLNHDSVNFPLPLHVAAHEGRIEFAEMLIKRGALVNKADKTGMLPITKTQSREMVRFLLKHGSDKKIGPHMSRMLIDELAKHGAEVSGKALENVVAHSTGGKHMRRRCLVMLRHGADTSVRNEQGLMPHEVALRTFGMRQKPWYFTFIRDNPVKQNRVMLLRKIFKVKCSGDIEQLVTRCIQLWHGNMLSLKDMSELRMLKVLRKKKKHDGS